MISFTINGSPYQTDAPDDMPLLWVIRDIIGLKGTKFGCGMGLCGACTVHLNGNAVRSCQTSLAATNKGVVTTIEGVTAIPLGSKIKHAWKELDVPQCGYCQPGQIMSATALLMANTTPSDSDINAAMAGNICRCGTYDRIRKAIHLAAEN